MRISKITIMRVSGKYDLTNVNELLQILGANLGLFSSRDKDKSCYRIFLTLLKDVKEAGKGLSSDEIAQQTKLSRGTVIHHLNRLMDAGLVTHRKGSYFLSEDTLEKLIEKVRADINKNLDELAALAKIIDKQLF